jgi:hypothetical protein
MKTKKVIVSEADEQKAIDYEVSLFNKKLEKLNKAHRHIQVTGIKLQINRPAPDYSHKPHVFNLETYKFWKWFKK